MDPVEISRLEEMFFQVWPADEVVDQNGWRLRFTREFSRRANSVFPNRWTGSKLAVDIDAVEGIYRARGFRPAFMMNPAAQPSGLPSSLNARGYSSDGVTSVRQTRAENGAALSPGVFKTSILPRMSLAWHAAYLDGAPDPVDQTGRASIMARISLPTAFATVALTGRIAGIGLAVLVGDRVVLQGMRTVPNARGRGAATAILGMLSRWALEQGVPDLMLQVELENPTAQSVYDKAGFAHQYGYDYCVLDN